MTKLSEWVEANMVRVSWGNYEGINDLSLYKLYALRDLVEAQITHDKIVQYELTNKN